MLKLTIAQVDMYDEEKNEFFKTKEYVLQLEHSLVSVSKWESKWCKPFLTTRVPKTSEESLDYIRCMTLTQNIDPEAYNFITQKNIDEVSAYIDAKMTATTFSNQEKTINREIITSELIYYWMIALEIPFECQKWHLNRLLTLINVCNIKNQKPKKRSQNEILSRNAALNASRRKALNTNG